MRTTKRINSFTYLHIALSVCMGVLVLFFVSAKANAETAEGKKIMVSLGDSYSSGEGIEDFYGQELDTAQKVKNEDWIAHRSQNSWPGMLEIPNSDGTSTGPMKNHKEDQTWIFGAVSGAITDDLYTSPNPDRYKYNKETGKYTGKPTLKPQLECFDLVSKNETDYVTLTLGGNDADFVGILKEAVLNCFYLNTSNLADKINYKLETFNDPDGLGDKLRNAYTAIADKAGPQAHILVAGYPQLLDPEGSVPIFKLVSVFSSAAGPGADAVGGAYEILVEKTYPSAAEIVNAGVHNFNQKIEAVVKECEKNGIDISFVPVEKEFAEHMAYSEVPFLNGFMTVQSEDIYDFIPANLIKIFSAYSIHPNYYGACAYARCVQERINEIEKKSLVVDLSDNYGILKGKLSGDADHLLDVYVVKNNKIINPKQTDETGNFIFELEAGTYNFCIRYDSLTILTMAFHISAGSIMYADDLLPKTNGFTNFDKNGIQTLFSTDYAVNLDLLTQLSVEDLPNERLARKWTVYSSDINSPSIETRAAECTDYRYDGNGNRRGEYIFTTDGSTQKWEWWRTNEYDVNGNMIRFATPDFGAPDSASVNVTDLTYNSQGQLLTSDNHSEDMPFKEYNVYNENGVLIDRVSQIGDQTTHFTFDGSGNVVQATTDLAYPWFDPGQEVDYYDNQYNELNQLIHVSVSREEYTNGALTVARYPRSETTYTYHPSGMESSVATALYYRADDGTVTMNGNHTTYFDEEGRLLSEEYDGQISEQYSYDENGNLLGTKDDYTVFLGHYPLLSYITYEDPYHLNGTAIGLYWYDDCGRLVGYSEGWYGGQEQLEELASMDIVYEYAPFDALQYTGELPPFPDIKAAESITSTPENNLPLKAEDIIWLVEPTYMYDDVKPIWSPDLNYRDPIEYNVYEDGGKYLPTYTPYAEYYSVSNEDGYRVFYMPDRVDSGDKVTSHSPEVFPGGIYFSSAREDYPQPWNLLQPVAGWGGAHFEYHFEDHTAYYEWAETAVITGETKMSVLNLHKPYAVAFQTQNTRYALYSPNGTSLTDFVYENMGTDSEGLIAVCKNGKWGYIDESGEEVVAPQFDAVWKTRSYIDESGKEVVGSQLGADDSIIAYPCTSDTIVVSLNGQMGVLYRDGSLLIDYGEFEDLAPAWNDQLWAKVDGNWGLIDLAAAKQKAGLPESEN